MDLFHFELKLNGRELELRTTRHPSEPHPNLLLRVLAWALCNEGDAEAPPEMSKGVCAGDEPTIQSLAADGSTKLWVEVGHPSAEKLDKATRSAESVKVFTQRAPAIFHKQLAKKHIHRREEIEVFHIAPDLLRALVEALERRVRWDLSLEGSQLEIKTRSGVLRAEIQPVSLVETPPS